MPLEIMNQIIDEINLTIAIIARDNTLISANKAMLNFAGVNLEEIIGKAYWEMPWWQHSIEMQNKILFAINDSLMGKSTRFEASQVDANGMIHEFDFILKPIMDKDEAKYFIAMGYNVTDLVSARKVLTERDRRIKALFDHSVEGYLFLSLPDTIDKNAINPQLIEEIVEHFEIESQNTRLESILGKKVESFKDFVHGINCDDSIEDIIREVVSEGSKSLSTKIAVNGEEKHIKTLLAAIYDDDLYEGSFAILRDVTQEVKSLNEITYLANKDFLTGINNRRSFYLEANTLIEESIENDDSVTMLMMDIDFFKRVNDTYGHEAGDYVIKTFAHNLSDIMCEKCVVGRYGGEEFVAIMPFDINLGYKAAEKIRSTIESYNYVYKDKLIKITTSIGLRAIDYEKDDLEIALNKADVALYESKQNGRNLSTIFIEEMHGESALDAVTGLLAEKSLGYKINKALSLTKRTEDSLWFIYLDLDIIEENEILSLKRHLQTVSECIKKVVSDKWLLGLHGDSGFVIGLRSVYSKSVHVTFDEIINNLELGFNGMVGSLINISGSVIDSKELKTSDEVFNKLKSNLVKLI